MKTVTIAGYLTQPKLAEALQQIVDPNDWLGTEIPVPKTRCKWDMGFKLDGRVVIVEFDGYGHYTEPLVIKRDREKDLVAAGLGYKVVRVPYWVQLTNETLEFYFGIKAQINQDFPHGFISKPPKLPSCYCTLGAQKFDSEINTLPDTVKNAIIQSLKKWAEKYGEEYVYSGGGQGENL